MLPERGTVRLGAEIEIAAWKNDYSFKQAAKDLVDAEYMVGPVDVWQKVHQWHCECRPGGCYIVRSGQVVDPPLVSMSHDSTLPAEGAEFIMSPVLMSSNGESMEHFREIWQLVTENAKWTNKLKDQKGRWCSPSVHMHVSAAKRSISGVGKDTQFEGEVLHALSLFAPEFFALAATVPERRGLTYRLPDRVSMASQPNGWHHGFIQVRRGVRNQYLHIEWRLFEAAYNNWPYVERASYLAAGLTRALLEETVFSQLMGTGYTYPFADEAIVAAVSANDVDKVLDLVSPHRMAVLRQTVLEHLDDDTYAQEVVGELFAETGLV